jgi:hypothetical protein
MGADRTLMQVKVRCGLGRVGVFGRLYGNSREMSAPGQLRRFNRVPTTSALPPRQTFGGRAGKSLSCHTATSRSFDVVDCLLVDGVSKRQLSPIAQRLCDALNCLGTIRIGRG